jgi:hypothetical protein
VRGELRPGGTEREWSDPDVLRRLRRASLARLRKQVEPTEQAALARFLPAWLGIDRRATLREALVPLQGLALPVALWETDVLPRRVPGYQPAELDQLCASGEVVWVGAGLERVALYFREDAGALGRPAALPPPEGEAHALIRAALEGTALFWYDLLRETALDPAEALAALWELVWAGEVTNDAWQPLRAQRRYATPREEKRPRRFSRSRSEAITATQGRWSTTARLFPGEADARALAELLLERQGIVTRDGVRAEGVPGGYSRVYQELRKLETLGVCRRGYFVEGLGGAQFALPGAVERLREKGEPLPLVLAAADPAQPYGAALAWPKRSGARAARVAGALVVLLGGEHTVSLAGYRALKRLHANAVLVQVDAHADLRAEWDGRAITHASWTHQAGLELGFDDVFQFGVRSLARAEWDAARLRVGWCGDSLELPDRVAERLRDRPVYVTVDIDVLDPSAAPGTGSPEPGGATFAELVRLLYVLGAFDVVAFDVVEVAPNLDPSEITAAAAAKLVREGILLFGTRRRRG